MIGRALFVLCALVAASAVAVACGGSNDAPSTPTDASADATNDPDAGDGSTSPDAAPDADFGAASDAFPAFRPPVPQIVTYGGPVMPSVRVVPVFFQGDPLEAQVLDFLQKYAAASYWRTAVKEYGVGDLSIAAPVVLTTPPGTSFTDSQMRSLLRASLDGTHSGWGAVDTATLATSIYVLFFPNGTAVVNDHRDPPVTACTPGNFYAYHSSVTRTAPLGDGGVDGASDAATEAGSDGGIEGGAGADDPILYAAMARCPGYGGFSQLDVLTALIVHEITEAASDPLVVSGPYGYSWVDDDHRTWVIPSVGGEVGDMCQNLPFADFRPTDVGYRIQRTWSNASMLAYHHPCVPIPATDGPFFASVPIEPDTIFIAYGMQQLRVKGVRLAVGQEKTIEVDLLSDGPRAPWAIVALDYSKDFRGQAASLGLTLDRSSGQNGEKVHLTIKALAQPASKTALYAIESRSSGQSMLWWGAVSVQ